MKALFILLNLVFAGISLYAQQWTQLNPPEIFFNNTINALTTDKTGTVYAAGAFTDSSSHNTVAALRNGAWADVGAGNALQAVGSINALAFDSLGNMYAGGSFTDASGAYYVAEWNGSQWSELGAGSTALLTGHMFALASDKAGNIYAGGELVDPNGHYYIARWNGQAWSEIGTGSQALNANGIMYSITCDGAGNIYTAGQFTDAAGHYYVAKWDGSQWTETGSGAGALNANSYITSLTVDGSGNIYAAGDFKDAAGYQYVAKWNGSSWSEVGTGGAALNANGTINAMVIDASGMIDVGGWFTAPEYYTIERWSGTAWSQVPAGGGVWPVADGDITSLAADRSGNLYVGGNFIDLNQNQYVAELSGSSWTETGTGATVFGPSTGTVFGVAVDTAGHVMTLTGPSNLGQVEYWKNGGWYTLPADPLLANVTVGFVVPDSAGNIYLYGNFSGTLGVAKWDGAHWTMLPAIGPQFLVAGATFMAVDKKGNLYLSCNNTTGLPAQILEWNGSVWQTYTTLGESLYLFVVDTAGTIYGAYYTDNYAQYNIDRITPANSTQLSGGTSSYANNANTLVHAMTFDAAGNLYIGGSYTDSSGNTYVAKWDGTNWTRVGPDLSNSGDFGLVSQLVFDNAGNLYASGVETNGIIGGIGKWNGQSWTDLSSPVGSSVIIMQRDARGNIYVAGGAYGPKGNAMYVFKYNNANQALPVTCSSNAAVVQLTASPDTVVSGSLPIVITASVVSGEGTNTSFTFSDEPNFAVVLQASGDSVLSVSSGNLPAGRSKIYVKVQTTNACDSVVTALDSIPVYNDTATSAPTSIDSSTVASPNPFTQFINVNGLSAAKSYSIFLYDGQGAKVWSMQANGVTSAQLTGPALPQGIYWLEVLDNSSGQRVSKTTVLKMQ